jgi:hypothetical protein
MQFEIVIEGLKKDTWVGNLSPQKVKDAARMSLNRVAARARTKSDRALREQIAFPARYLGPASQRLWVRQKASNENLEAIIRGQGRPTSLARFAGRAKPPKPGQGQRGGGVNVMVKPGQRQFINRAFLIRLNNNNTGLAVRTAGGKPANSYKPKMIGKNLYLLYGPSVDQALLDARQKGGIYEEISQEMLDEWDAEFARLLQVEMNRA